jgi:nucleoid DNA-binding protein
MLKRQFISQVAARSNLSAAQIRRALDATRDIAIAQLIQTGRVRVPGLVTLKVLKRSSRVARNPKTGDECVVAAGHTVKSRPVATLSARVSDQLED